MSFSAKLSCIMVTQKDRLGLAMRAIHNLLAWESMRGTYFDPHELIIIHDHQKNPFAKLPFEVRRKTKIRTIYVQPTTSLHDRFRRGVELSEGDWITFTDDDVFYHSMRLTYQMEIAEETPDRPCVIAEGMYYFFDTKELFVVKPAKYPAHSLDNKVIPYSAVFPKDFFIGFPDNPGHPVCNCLNFMGAKQMPITIIRDQWKWACVGIRGDNLHGYQHFRDRVINDQTVKSVRWLHGMWPEIFGVMDCYSWDGDVDLCGHDGSQGRFCINTLWPADLPAIGVPADDIERVTEDVSDD